MGLTTTNTQLYHWIDCSLKGVPLLEISVVKIPSRIFVLTFQAFDKSQEYTTP